MIGDLFPTVTTPPWEERFEPTTTFGGKSACVVCGATGITPPKREADNGPRWAHHHGDHVRCPCGKVTTRRGMGRHRSATEQHGHPCPPIGSRPRGRRLVHTGGGRVVHVLVPGFRPSSRSRTVPDGSALCGASVWANSSGDLVDVDLPVSDPLRWCPRCLGMEADRQGYLGDLVQLLELDGRAS